VAGDGEAVVTVTAAALKPSDRLMADGVHYAPATFPQVVGLDGVGRLADGTRVAFLPPQQPWGGMAERALLRQGMWLPVPDGVDDVTAAAVLNPGMAAWKSIVWEGELTAGQTVLVLGATGASGRIAAQLARRHGARVVAGRMRRSGSTAPVTSWPRRSPPRGLTTWSSTTCGARPRRRSSPRWPNLTGAPARRRSGPATSWSG
jgi:NADPH:quinone reductase-like Zn-dependent oxidoreductase